MRLLLLPLVVCAIFLVSVHAVNRPSGTVDYTKSAESAANGGPLYAKYDTIEIHVRAKDNRTKQEWTSKYYPRVDEFSLLELTFSGGITFNYSFNPNLTVWLEFPNRPWVDMSLMKPKRVYTTETTKNGEGVIIPYFTGLVLLNKGNVTQLAWDGGCGSCGSDVCLDDQCGRKRLDNNVDICFDATKAYNCNIKFYLAWTGRDKEDSKCRSVSSTPNSFKQYSSSPLTNFGNGLFGDVVYRFTQNAPNPVKQTA